MRGAVIAHICRIVIAFMPLRKHNLEFPRFRASFQRMIFSIRNDFIMNYHVWTDDANLYGNNYHIRVICVIHGICAQDLHVYSPKLPLNLSGYSYTAWTYKNECGLIYLHAANHPLWWYYWLNIWNGLKGLGFEIYLRNIIDLMDQIAI